MTVTDLKGVGPVTAQRLDAAGLGTIEAIAGASIDDLTSVAGIGTTVATRLRDQALELGVAPAPSNGQAKVTKSVAGLHQAIPDLAKSKKHAKSLKKSTKRMAAMTDDLDRNKVRKQIIAETNKISADAKKRTGSKKDAKTLRKHAARIEKAVKQIG